MTSDAPGPLSPHAATVYRRCLTLVHLARVIVPAHRRDEWTREWTGELWDRAALLDRSPQRDGRSTRRLLTRTLGAFPHALWMLTNELRVDPMLQDLTYALRGFLKHPGFATLVVATLALGDRMRLPFRSDEPVAFEPSEGGVYRATGEAGGVHDVESVADRPADRTKDGERGDGEWFHARSERSCNGATYVASNHRTARLEQTFNAR